MKKKIIFYRFKGVFFWTKSIPEKWGARLSEISPYERILLKYQNLFIWMLILQPNRITTLIKCKKTFDEMRNTRNELLTSIW